MEHRRSVCCLSRIAGGERQIRLKRHAEIILCCGRCIRHAGGKYGATSAAAAQTLMKALGSVSAAVNLEITPASASNKTYRTRSASVPTSTRNPPGNGAGAAKFLARAQPITQASTNIGFARPWLAANVSMATICHKGGSLFKKAPQKFLLIWAMGLGGGPAYGPAGKPHQANRLDRRSECERAVDHGIMGGAR